MSIDLKEKFFGVKNLFVNLLPEELIEHTIIKNQGYLSDKGALCIRTGQFTGRAPLDRFIVMDDLTRDSIDWGSINQPLDGYYYTQIKEKLIRYFKGKDLYIRDAVTGADPEIQLKVRVYSEYPWSSLFVYNMFLRRESRDIGHFEPDWQVFNAPGFEADPETDGTRQKNFAILNFTEKTILIGGTGYTGEIKKGIFTVMNFFLPGMNALPMHCSANVGKYGNTAIFFGLSGTGKTTLSANPERMLIGDDEHGWSDHGIFNFEGGCYAKCIDLSEEKEPDIYRAIRHGAMLENIVFIDGTREPDYTDDSITPNTRASYPIQHIKNAVTPSIGDHPQHIFFLTADAFGVLPPISRLNPGQAMYHFLSGYTAKVAGTEEGIIEPAATFSTCFGAPFMPLPPTVYADMLGKKMRKFNTKIWLVNTGWTGGPYGVGSRINLKFTRAIIRAALRGELNHAGYHQMEIFKVEIPNYINSIPTTVLTPRNTWTDKQAYDKRLKFLAQEFQRNFIRFSDKATEETKQCAPQITPD